MTAFKVVDDNTRVENLIPEFKFNQDEERLLVFPTPNLKRCTKCILPETMPYIKFDEEGVCVIIVTTINREIILSQKRSCLN
jgi:glucosamine--fructose-6-phosphate aminotransferase (isomerizing)